MALKRVYIGDTYADRYSDLYGYTWVDDTPLTTVVMVTANAGSASLSLVGIARLYSIGSLNAQSASGTLGSLISSGKSYYWGRPKRKSKKGAWVLW